MKKRILSLLLVFVMCLTMLPTSSLAAGKVALKISAANASPSKGDTVTFSVTVGEVKNLTNMEFVIDVPEGLTYVEKSAKLADGLKETLMVAAADWTETTKKFTMYGDSAYTSATDTLIMTFDCKVNDDASGTLSVSVRDDLSISDIEYEEMDVTVVPAIITIGSVTPPAHTHDLKKVDAKDATCTEDGNIEYYQCSDSTCGKLYKDAAGTQEITLADTVIKAAHTGIKLYPAKAPTCTDDGCIAYWFCTGCDNYYFDNDGAVGAETTVEKVAISATGHKWELVVKEVEGATTHTKECKVCGKTEEETHDKWPGDEPIEWTSNDDYHWHQFACGTIMDKAAHTWNAGVETTPATCTKAGEKTLTCTVCGHEKIVTIPKADHQYKWTNDETNHWQECTVCGDIIDKAEHTYASHKCEDTATCTKAECGYVKPAGQHTWDAGVETTPATCTTDGVKTYTCTVCQATKTEPIAALGHAYGEPAWSWSEDGKTATATFTCANNSEHISTEQATIASAVKKAASCTEMGTTTYTATVTFEGKDYTAAKDVQDIKALGHSMTKTEAKAATCTEAGNSEYYTCGTCGKFFSDEAGENEIKQDSWVKNALGHDFKGDWVNTDAAGHYHKCSRCDVTDEVIKHTYSGKPCDKADNCTVCGYVKAAGVHAWGTAEYKWGDDNMSCTATVKCTNCEAVETDAAAIGINTTPATCTVDGKTVYTATFSSELFTTQTKEVTIDKLGHTYGAPVWSWSEDGKTATATFTCTREGCTAETTGHAQTVTATVSGKQNVAPTCTDKGTTTYTAKVTFEKKDYADTKDVQDINALGHKLTKTPAKAETCETAGNKEYYTCGTCGKFFSDADGKNEIAKDSWVIAALGHKMTKMPAKAATCVAEGNNEYYTCSVCNKVFKDEQGTKPTTVRDETLAKNPNNHVGTEERGAVAASCMTAGRTADTYCTGCGKKLPKDGDGEIIPATGKHNYVNGVCTTCGNKQPANGDTIKAAIEKVVADAKEAVEEALDKAIENETNANTKEILKKLKSYVSGSSKLQAVYNVTMTKGEKGDTPLAKGETLADAQNVTIAISEETYNALRSGAKIVESYLVDDKGEAQTREINATLNKTADGGYTVTFTSDKTAVYGLMTKTSSGGGSGSGSSYTSGQSFTTDLPADSINRVTVNGKKLDSKYYTVSSNGSGSIVTLTDAYLATLKAGKYTVKIENKTHVSTGTFTIKADGTLSSPKTADAGIALYAMLAVSSLMGTAVVSKKRRKA